MTNAEVDRCHAGRGLSNQPFRYGELCHELIRFAWPYDCQLIELAIGRVVAACFVLPCFEFIDYDSVLWCLTMVIRCGLEYPFGYRAVGLGDR
jgi:hypothetical protein